MTKIFTGTTGRWVVGLAGDARQGPEENMVVGLAGGARQGPQEYVVVGLAGRCQAGTPGRCSILRKHYQT